MSCIMDLCETLVLWNKKHTYHEVDELIKSISDLKVPLCEPDEYNITKKKMHVSWTWGEWIPSLNKPEKDIRISLDINLYINKKGVLWTASDFATYRDFIIPQPRAFTYISQLCQNIDQYTLLACRSKIVENLPYKIRSQWSEE